MAQIPSLSAFRVARSRAQSANASVSSLPAPVGGWNARDSIAAMSPTDAVILENWFPTTSDVMVRMGYTQFATGIPTQVNSVMGYNPSAGTHKLFAAAGTAVYDVSLGGAVGAPVISSLTSDKWIHTNFSTSAGPFMLMVNGADGYYVYNGTTWQSVTSSSTPVSITGVDPTTLTHVTSFASRVWFIQKASLKAWYLPVGQIGGAATVFDLSAIFRRGGNLVAAGVWTVDGGYGMQDYICWVTSEGEIAVYGGTDPSQASTFNLVGVYRLGSPMGNRCFQKYGSDLLYVGKDGLAPMSKALASTRVDTQVNLTAKIQGAISEATSLYANNFGWCMVLYPLNNMVILNVPVALNAQQQYVMNTITGAWCPFKGWNANCWELFDDKIYFGGNGYVGLAWNTFSDNGQNINAVGLQAFNDFGMPAVNKRFTMMRPILWTNGSPAIFAGVNVNYDQNVPQSTLNFAPVAYGVWDSSAWDLALWGGSLNINNAWQGVTGIGSTGAPILKATTNGIETHWVSTDLVMESGWTL
jgi:hypothetical protein